MKLYLALNEHGTHGDIALHTKLAVLSARKHSDLDIKMLYIGRRNEFTQWLETHGVEILDQHLPYYDLIKRLSDEGKYNLSTVGHWLRTNVCLTTNDDYVLYSDIDVLFLSNPIGLEREPSYFMAAPEFKKDGWNYFNAGVMHINVRKFQETYPEFEKYIRKNIEEKTYQFHDQIAYNTFYRGKWEKLALEMNWKVYWGANKEAKILHFHGPKLGAINAILSGQWDWNNEHGRQIGSIFAQNISSYRYYIAFLLDYIDELSHHEREFILDIHYNMSRDFDTSRYKPDTTFMNFKMFPED
ncbi:glycosyltransferase [Gluconacetobacter asukensis]|uniref:Uncharacterized protein n=1 Tax=Gluconacetobacter asukensis TaxID=1017181 RepID=A0A7W4IYX5_9PROT|nr:glycosyltransferase [Gluconacetobacter asukensis]MBB2171347.1 hypothetical protein [Gluconacetobacter asukensis]